MPTLAAAVAAVAEPELAMEEAAEAEEEAVEPATRQAVLDWCSDPNPRLHRSPREP